jgi:hypothetical protein
LRKAAGEFEVELGSALAAHHWRHEKPKSTDAEIESTFVTILDAVERLTTVVDALEL